MANPIVTFEMQDGGKIVAELYPDIAPQSVRNFIALAGAALINVGGYWIYESLAIYHDFVSAVASMPFNLAQSAVGAVIFIALAKPAYALVKRSFGDIL